MEFSLEHKRNPGFKILVTTYFCVKTSTPRLFNYLLVVNPFTFYIRLKNTMQCALLYGSLNGPETQEKETLYIVPLMYYSSGGFFTPSFVLIG